MSALIPITSPEQAHPGLMDQILTAGGVFHCRGVYGERMVQITQSLAMPKEGENVLAESFADSAETALIIAIGACVLQEDAGEYLERIETSEQSRSKPFRSIFDFMVWNGYVTVFFNRTTGTFNAATSRGVDISKPPLQESAGTGLAAITKLTEVAWKKKRFGKDARLLKKLPSINIPH